MKHTKEKRELLIAFYKWFNEPDGYECSQAEKMADLFIKKQKKQSKKQPNENVIKLVG